jgi:PilZ domain
MTERRLQPRLTACELVMVGWHDGAGKLNQLGNVQDLSLDGMGILIHDALPVGTPVTVSYGYGELTGTVRHSSQLIDATFIGIEFDEASKNSILHFQPELLIREF